MRGYESANKTTQDRYVVIEQWVAGCIYTIIHILLLSVKEIYYLLSQMFYVHQTKKIKVLIETQILVFTINYTHIYMLSIDSIRFTDLLMTHPSLRSVYVQL